MRQVRNAARGKLLVTGSVLGGVLVHLVGVDGAVVDAIDVDVVAAAAVVVDADVDDGVVVAGG
eukprot:15270985-Alexandrium_andersonii.AAC.1